jgi:KipI family sensor histidine kinase inhibitor
VSDASPGHRTLLVEVEPEARDEVAERLSRIAAEVEPLSGRSHKVPIRYDGEDVDWVCRRAGLNRGQLEEIHSRKTYDVRMIGSPKFIYLSSVPTKIAVPRLEDPRLVVPEGSVGIGGRQTGIYGLARPGGWRLIGTVLEVPAVSPGDRVKFVPH